jgi:hypothetical protein
MTYFYDRFWFSPGSRLTGFWLWPSAAEQSVDALTLASYVSLGAGQDSALEADFLCSHLPWAVGGFHGVDADGEPWLVVLQSAPGEAAQAVGSSNDWWPMVDGLEQALRWNELARVQSSDGLDRDKIVEIYEEAGVDVDLIVDWTINDLLSGLLAGCAYVPLVDVVAGRLVNCAFPNEMHECEHDVFRDVFAAWANGRLSAPDPEEADDDDVPTSPRRPRLMLSWRWDKKKVKRWSTTRVRLQAVEDGWTAKKAYKASRKELVRYLTKPHRLRGLRVRSRHDEAKP